MLSWRCVLGGCRYVKLMLKRIKWDAKEEHDEEDDDEDDEDEEDYAAGSGGSSKCELIWKGTVHKAAFNGFKFQVTRMPSTLRALKRCQPLSPLTLLDVQHIFFVGFAMSLPRL